jgi:hypothetical protein
MTESEWQACTDPQKMLEFLEGKMSERKCRLFIVACCRRIWHLFTDERSQKAVEVAERNADGFATSVELAEAYEAARPPVHQMGMLNVFAAYAACESCSSDLLSSLRIGGETNAQRIAHAVVVAVKREYNVNEARVIGWSRQDEFLRCIFGNLFRPVTINPAWLTWNNSTVRKMAQAIYDERAFNRMPILADALEEPGCTNPDILAHCRQSGNHVLGCWVVDLILGKG